MFNRKVDEMLPGAPSGKVFRFNWPLVWLFAVVLFAAIGVTTVGMLLMFLFWTR